MSAEFPRIALLSIVGRIGHILTQEQKAADQAVILLAVQRYDELAERLVFDATQHSIEVGNLRARLRDVDPQSLTP